MTTSLRSTTSTFISCLLFIQILSAQTHDCVPMQMPPPGQPVRAVPSILFFQDGDPTDLNGPYTGAPSAPFVHGDHWAPQRPAPVLPPNDPVDYLTGNFHHSVNDLSFQVLGRSFHLQRYYNSKSIRTGSFGPKWTHNYALQLVKHLDRSVSLETGYGSFIFALDKDTTYQAPPGLFFQLTRNAFGEYRLEKPNREVFLFNIEGQLTTVADRFGNEIKLTYQTSGELAKIFFPLGHTFEFLYQSDGRIAMVKGPNNQWAAYCYDAEGHLVETTDVHGLSTTYQYNRDQHLVEIGQPDGRSFRYDYHWDGKLLHSTDPAGHTESFKYPNVMGLFPINKTVFTDKNGLTWEVHYQNGVVNRVVDPDGNSTRYRYGKKNRLLEEIQWPDQSQEVFAYDEAGRLTEAQNAIGQKTTYRYDQATGMLSAVGNGSIDQWEYRYNARGYLETIRDPSGLRTQYFCNTYNLPDSIQNAHKQFTEFSYAAKGLAMASIRGNSLNHYSFDEQGRLLAHQAPTGAVTSYQYDPYGMISRIAYPNGVNWKYHYRSDGMVRALSNNKDQVYCFQYDRLGRLSTLSDPLDQIQTFHYDAKGNLAEITDALGNRRVYGYDAYDRLIQEQDAHGETTRYKYDRLGHLASVQTATKAIRRYAFNPVGQLQALTNPMGFRTRFEYNQQGKLQRTVDPLDHQTQYSYDQMGNLLYVLSPGGFETAFSYDALGRLRKLTNAAGQIYRYQYDANNLLVGEADPLNNWHWYEYDEGARLILERTRRGDTIRYRYDDTDKLLERSYQGHQDNFRYQNATLLAEAGNENIHYQYTYDVAGQLIAKHIPEWNLTIRYAYDAEGNRTSLQLPGIPLSFAYDENHRLIRVEDPVAGTTEFDYDQAGRLNLQCHANGSYTSYYHYDSDLLEGLHTRKSDGEPLDLFQYYYDQTGHVLAITQAGDLHRSFGYDRESRLTQAIEPGGQIEQFTYDSLGNRKTWTLDDKTRTYTYDEAGRLLSFDSIAYEHDLNGNLNFIYNAGDTTELIFDGVGNLVQIRNNDQLVFQYAYDPFGRRISRTDSSGQVRHYLYDGHQMIAEMDLDNRILRRFNYYSEMDALVQIVQDTQAFYVHRDAFGNVLSISDRSEKRINVYEYGAFGNLTGKEEGVPQNLLFQGREQEPTAGFYYFRHRFYQPEWGRFLSQDPFEGYPNLPLSLNKYIYAYDNPLKFRDPSGTDPSNNYQAFDLLTDQVQIMDALLPNVPDPETQVRRFTHFQTSGKMPSVQRPFRKVKDRIGRNFQGF